MVAISLYRGNLHRVPDVPRRWLMPSRQISLKEFKSLLHRRSKALSRLRSSAAAVASPNPNSKDKATAIDFQLKADNETNRGGEGTSIVASCKDQGGLDVGQCSASLKPSDVSNSSPAGKKPEVAEKVGDEGHEANENLQDLKLEKQDASTNPNTESDGIADAMNDREKRKKEVEEKLEVLNQKKHNLVQVLKQILNVEEELKRRNILANRSNVPLQVDVTNDSGSLSRQATPRMGSEANPGGDVEGGENEDVPNQNSHSRHMLRMSSTSPSSESPLRKPPYIQNNVVASRTSLATGSPSRFAPIGHQGAAANPPTVSVSGTSYIASSPSPAASGGTSTFRDARQPSPWN